MTEVADPRLPEAQRWQAGSSPWRRQDPEQIRYDQGTGRSEAVMMCIGRWESLSALQLAACSSKTSAGVRIHRRDACLDSDDVCVQSLPSLCFWPAEKIKQVASGVLRKEAKGSKESMAVAQLKPAAP
ncbi:unnamed protein product [Symbiodinium natans]|uniref:Uncharacterized protein n=1 Tax=Symbiodinium natans TaxID=878477 RepID=A0A812SKK6_9DINO|nr:unnamed protein product [Symbiodinium natans]